MSAENLPAPLPASELARAAPNWEAMRTAIATCERMDEVRNLSDQAIALRVYFAQSGDVDNELAAMRIRLRAERRFGELKKREQEAGRLATQADHGKGIQASVDSDDTRMTLSDLGISRDRAARATKLAEVPEAAFEAALQNGRPSSRSLAALAPKHEPTAPKRIDVQPVLKTWGMLRDLHAALNDGSMLPAQDWDKHPGIQQFQINEIRRALPALIAYLTALRED